MSDNVGSLGVSESQWLAELEDLRPTHYPTAKPFSAVEDRMLLAARSGPRPVAWETLRESFREHGYIRSRENMVRRYKELTKGGADSSK